MTALAIDVVNPATGEALTRVPSDDASGVGAAIARARAAQPAWAALPFSQRKRLLRRLAHPHGIEGLRQFCRIQSIVEDRAMARGLSALIARRLQFPYRRKVRKAVEWLLPRLYR